MKSWYDHLVERAQASGEPPLFVTYDGMKIYGGMMWYRAIPPSENINGVWEVVGVAANPRKDYAYLKKEGIYTFSSREGAEEYRDTMKWLNESME